MFAPEICLIMLRRSPLLCILWSAYLRYLQKQWVTNLFQEKPSLSLTLQKRLCLFKKYIAMTKMQLLNAVLLSRSWSIKRISIKTNIFHSYGSIDKNNTGINILNLFKKSPIHVCNVKKKISQKYKELLSFQEEIEGLNEPGLSIPNGATLLSLPRPSHSWYPLPGPNHLTFSTYLPFFGILICYMYYHFSVSLQLTIM